MNDVYDSKFLSLVEAVLPMTLQTSPAIKPTSRSNTASPVHYQHDGLSNTFFPSYNPPQRSGQAI